MKKILALLLCAVMIFAMSACTTSLNDTPDDETKTSEETLTQKALKGTWKTDCDIDDIIYMEYGKTMIDYLLEEAGIEGVDLGGLNFNEKCNVVMVMDFNGKGKVDISMDCDELSNYLTELFDEFFEYISTPEVLAAIMGYELDELESYLDEKDIIMEEFIDTTMDGIYEKFGDVDKYAENFVDEIEDEFGTETLTYEIDGNNVYIDDDRDEYLEYKDGMLYMTVNETELVFKKE